MGPSYPHIVEYGNPHNSWFAVDPTICERYLMGQDETPYAEIGNRLRQIRELFSNLSQREWAQKHGFPPTRWNNWEKGTRRIPVECAENLCNLYGLTLDFIYRGRRDGLSEKAANSL